MKKIIMLIAVFGFAAALSASAADAKANWDTICAKCHGADGKGQTKIGQMLGIKDADGKTKMKAFVTGADTPLSDDEVKALVAYVRGLKT